MVMIKNPGKFIVDMLKEMISEILQCTASS